MARDTNFMTFCAEEQLAERKRIETFIKKLSSSRGHGKLICDLVTKN
jgi:hypothetical protein